MFEGEEDGETAPEMNALCGGESDDDEGLFGLREVREIDGDEAIAAFTDGEEEGEDEDVRVGEVHMLTATGAIRPGPTYWWGRPGGPGRIYQDYDRQREHCERPSVRGVP